MEPHAGWPEAAPSTTRAQPVDRQSPPRNSHPPPDSMSHPRELLIDCEEDRTLRAVLVGMLAELERKLWP